ncbi:MAG: serpin family protein [Saprospiraceae bacterium]
MKYSISLLFMVIIMLSCSKQIDPDDNMDSVKFECADNQKVCDLSYDNASFGFDILKKLHNSDEDNNLFISPFSISSALSMAMNGAKNETLEQMMNSLQYSGWNLDSLNAAYRDYLVLLPLLDNNVVMKNANSIWYKNGYPVLEDYLTTCNDYFKSEIESRDFSDEATLDEINQWVEDNTEGKIKDILDMIPGDAVMYLINAIYFKGTWKYKFDEKNTYKGDFTLQNGGKVSVDMMNEEELPVSYYNDEMISAIDIPYGDSIYSITILLPNSGYNIDNLIDGIDIDYWNEITSGFYHVTMNVTVPKFKIEYKNEISKILSDLGMPIAFTSMADFSGINGFGNLFISRVIHQSFVEVDEAGTEAAAATVVEVLYNSIQDNYFVADKPFVFVIKENKTNSILFIGKLMDPS